jgi:hypothetical protein
MWIDQTEECREGSELNLAARVGGRVDRRGSGRLPAWALVVARACVVLRAVPACPLRLYRQFTFSFPQLSSGSYVTCSTSPAHLRFHRELDPDEK